MKNIYVTTFISIFILCSCSTQDQTVKSDKELMVTFQDSLSYSMGINIGKNLPEPQINQDLLIEGLNDYWSKQTNQIITFEKLMYDYGSPGKVFQLDEKSMEQYLEKLEMDSKNFVFSKGAGGLRQITKVKEISENQLLKNCYKKVA